MVMMALPEGFFRWGGEVLGSPFSDDFRVTRRKKSSFLRGAYLGDAKERKQTSYIIAAAKVLDLVGHFNRSSACSDTKLIITSCSFRRFMQNRSIPYQPDIWERIERNLELSKNDLRIILIS
jgi:hypothetical protein